MGVGTVVIVVGLLGVGACGGQSARDAGNDAGNDADRDVGVDSSRDTGSDTALEVSTDARRDTEGDAAVTMVGDQCCCEHIVEGDIMIEELRLPASCEGELSGRCIQVDPMRLTPHPCCPEATGERCGDVVDAGCREDQIQVGSECVCPPSEHERMGVCVPDVERHPGHWVLLSDLESIRVPADAAPADREDLTALDEIASSSANVTGVLARFFWRDLNTADGVFELGRIEEQLDHLAAIAAAGGPSLQYAPLIAWRSYAAADHPMPDYLSSFEEPAAEGHRGQVWKPEVRARYRELLESMQAAVGDHAHFGGVATQETAVGPEPRDGYSPSLFAEALTDIGVMHREIFPRKEIFFIFNYLSATPAACTGLDRETDCGSWPSDRSECGPCLLGHVISTLASYDIALGGPDILPDNASLVSQVYPHYPALHAAGARLFCHAQKDSYRVADGGGFMPMQEIFDFARNDLHVDYVFWFHKETGTGQDYDAAVPVIEANPLPWL